MRRTYTNYIGFGLMLIAINASAQNTFPATGNVGIGTTSPAYPLDINGTVRAANFILSSGGTFSIDASQINRTDGFVELQYGGANGVRIFGATPNPVAFIPGGRIGLGTITPTQKLSISQGSITMDAFGYMSSYRGPTNNFTNLFLGGSISDNGNGTYTVQTDGGSNYFAAIRMDNAGGNAGAINFYSAPTVGGSAYTLTNAQFVGYQTMTILGGNVGIGTTAPGAKLEIAGNVRLTAGSGASMTYQDGTMQTTAWNGVLSGGDYAESVDVIGDRTQYEPGDVLVIDPSSKGKFMKSTEAYSTAVMGIYSTRPGVVGRRQSTDKSHMKEEVPMAMVGVVPTKVSAESGAIKPGDLLVTSSKPGYAMKGSDHSQMMGAIIGKALEPLDAGTGVIEVAVSIQ